MLAHGGIHGRKGLGKLYGGGKEVPQYPMGASGRHDSEPGKRHLTEGRGRLQFRKNIYMAGLIWHNGSRQKREKRMEKYILDQYSNALARVNILKKSISNIEDKRSKMNERGYYVTDVTNKGKKGKKTLGTVTIAGFPHEEYERLSKKLEKRMERLLEEEKGLLGIIGEVEEYISGIGDIEIRNIMSLYYVENLTWVQVAHRMNAEYKKRGYTENSCRRKHDRFFEKNS